MHLSNIPSLPFILAQSISVWSNFATCNEFESFFTWFFDSRFPPATTTKSRYPGNKSARLASLSVRECFAIRTLWLTEGQRVPTKEESSSRSRCNLCHTFDRITQLLEIWNVLPTELIDHKLCTDVTTPMMKRQLPNNETRSEW